MPHADDKQETPATPQSLDLTRFKPDHATLLPDNFLLYVSARSGAGKSHLVTWLCSLPEIRGRFHAALVISPTSNLGVYKQFEFVAPSFHHADHRKMPQIFATLRKTSRKLRDEHGVKFRCLVICDDFLTDSRSAGQSSRALAEFVSVRRHSGVSMILISQRIQACSPSIRNQCSMFVSFSPRTLDDRRFIVRNFLTRELVNSSQKDTLALAEQILDNAFAASPYAAIAIDCVSQSLRMLENVYVMVAPAEMPKFKLRLRKTQLGGFRPDGDGGPDALLKAPGGRAARVSPADVLSLSVREDEPEPEVPEEPPSFDLG